MPIESSAAPSCSGVCTSPTAIIDSADADKEDHHHVAAAPAIAEPAGQQRAGAERDEARGGVRQQFGIGHAERRPHHDDGGGEDQHRIMVDEVGGVDEADHPGGAVHGIAIPGRILHFLG